MTFLYIEFKIQILILYFSHQNFDNYCSKCYNDLFGKNDVKHNDMNFSNSKCEDKPVSNPISIRVGKSYGYPDYLNVSTSMPNSFSKEVSPGTSPSSFQEKSLSKQKRRICAAEGCRKKLLLTSVECKCGKTFCSGHRYAEQHNCGFDYKESKKELLNKANPVVAPSKITEI